YLLHNDLWLWNDPRLVLGLPVGLVYHVVFCVAVSAVLSLLVIYAWPPCTRGEPGDPDDHHRLLRRRAPDRHVEPPPLPGHGRGLLRGRPEPGAGPPAALALRRQ